MNLPLHLGLLGVMEAGLISFLVGLLVYAVWHRIVRIAGGSGRALFGGASLIAIVVAAGIDGWNLFYLGVARLESPLYARLALQGIHDADSLGVRVTAEIIGALLGVLAGWQLFSGGFAGRSLRDVRQDDDRPT
ncbi:MAG: hypothetical protein EOP92_34140 [Lysobacteraceae bacterium]|nr:MAG: hypothetical protein EOP92_34140 [Xanthomonadaceae bacterium]